MVGLSAFMADDDPITSLLKKLDEITSKYPQEKVYLHLDKPFYAVGDEIWFKAYLVDAKTGAPTAHSEVLYIDLINESDVVKKQVKLPMSGGITWGNISLTDSLSEGNYRLRAYTNWMRNAGPNFFYDRTIKIGNSWANKIFTKSQSTLSNGQSGQNISTTINFSDKNALPYSKCGVSYQLMQDGKSMAKGKGETNENGDLKIEVENLKTALKEDAFIAATITLPNKQTFTKNIVLQAAKANYDVQLFPEGGTLVENLPSKIGFKAVNSYGRGEDVSGKVVDDTGSEILNFQSSHLGMGNFILNPLSGKSYKAIISFKDGSTKTIDLPKAQTSGYIISANNTSSEKINVKVISSTDMVGKGELYLVGQHNGSVYFSTKISSDKQLSSINIPKAQIPSGILQLTLFNAQFMPLVERIVFVNNTADKIDLNISELNESYGSKTNVKATITTKVDGKPMQGTFSVAVTNNDAVQPDPENESNILTSLLLTSDLSGYVEKPNYYFLKDDAKTTTDLDNLLLTQGWRKINWKSVTSGVAPAFAFQPEKGISVSGKVLRSGKPVVKGKVMLISNSNGFFMLDTLTDAEGRFSFDKLQFGDSTKFIVQARTEKDKKFVDVELDKYPGQNVTTNKNTGDIEVNVNQAITSYLKQSENYFNDLARKGWLNRTVLLNEVKIVEKKNPAPNSSNLNGAGRADQVFTAKDMENAVTLSQFLQGRIVGTSIRNGLAYSLRNGNGPMAIVLDGMNMSMGGDMGGFTLDDIVVQDVESVEILRSIGNTAIYGSQGGNGVIVITTKRGGGSAINRYTPGIVVVSPQGFSTIKEFYSPKYDSPQNETPDFRSTIFWQPQLVTNPDGTAKLSYYTGQPGTYRIVIEGIDEKGNLARKVTTHEVK